MGDNIEQKTSETSVDSKSIEVTMTEEQTTSTTVVAETTKCFEKLRKNIKIYFYILRFQIISHSSNRRSNNQQNSQKIKRKEQKSKKTQQYVIITR